MSWAERRNLDGNRRASGWRWGAARADTRTPSRIMDEGEQRVRNRRKDDRDDDPRVLASGAASPQLR